MAPGLARLVSRRPTGARANNDTAIGSHAKRAETGKRPTRPPNTLLSLRRPHARPRSTLGHAR
eukprot:10111251-Lingulodinium_polyedra.AAC.1